jgi:calmodulin
MDFSEQQINDFKVAFGLFDINQDGVITTPELGIALRNLGQNPTEAELQQMIQELDTDQNGTIEFEELLSLISRSTAQNDLEKDIRDIFKILDRKEEGFVSLDDLKHIVKCSGLKISEEEMVQMLQEADLDGDDKISFDEFYQIVRPNKVENNDE